MLDPESLANIIAYKEIKKRKQWPVKEKEKGKWTAMKYSRCKGYYCSIVVVVAGLESLRGQIW